MKIRLNLFKLKTCEGTITKSAILQKSYGEQTTFALHIGQELWP